MDLLVKPARVKHGKLASLLEPPEDDKLRPAATKSEFSCGPSELFEYALFMPVAAVPLLECRLASGQCM